VWSTTKIFEAPAVINEGNKRDTNANKFQEINRRVNEKVD